MRILVSDNERFEYRGVIIHFVAVIHACGKDPRHFGADLFDSQFCAVFVIFLCLGPSVECDRLADIARAGIIQHLGVTLIIVRIGKLNQNACGLVPVLMEVHFQAVIGQFPFHHINGETVCGKAETCQLSFLVPVKVRGHDAPVASAVE